jgi:hypothetical protein
MCIRDTTLSTYTERYQACYSTVYWIQNFVMKTSVWTLWKALVLLELKKKLHGLSPRANYIDRATAACRRSDSQLLRMEGARGQRDGSLRPYSRFSRQEPLLFLSSSSSVVLTRLSGPRSRPITFVFLVVPGIEPGPPDLWTRTLTTRLQRRSSSS